MTVQYSLTVNNNKLDNIESTVGTAPLLRLYTGAAPANCGTAASGTKLSDDALPSDWLANASAGSKAKAGTWTLNGIAAGSAGHFRVYDSSGTTCHMQGTVTATGGGGDMTMDNVVVANLQVITVNTFTITSANL